MKLIQISLCGSYNSKMGYQDNILPKYYVKLGFECITIASRYYKEKGIIKYEKVYRTILSNKSEIIRLQNKFGLSYKINKYLRLYSGLYDLLTKENPDIIFLHNYQFLSILDLVKYCKINKNVKVYADSHTDYINSGTNWFSMNIFHKIIWRFCVKKIEPFIIKFWGVTDQRCRFLEEVYRIPKQKIDLLVMGADDDQINFTMKEQIRSQIREKHFLSNNDFLLISGGKIDKNKNIHLLVNAVNKIEIPQIKLILFGSIDEEMKRILTPLLNCNKIRFINWLDSDKVYDYFLASDLGVFLGTHSVLWEQAIGSGLPCIFKRWEGIEHIDLGGNCLLLENLELNVVISEIIELYKNKELFLKMKSKAEISGIKAFLYSEIAKKSIEFNL